MRRQRLRVTSYRSVKAFAAKLGAVTTIIGENGAGKQSLPALLVLSAATRGELRQTLANEGDMPSVRWAADRSRDKGPRRMTMGIVFDTISNTP